MNRRDTVLALLALGAMPVATRVQPAAKPARIGYLGFSDPEAAGNLVNALKHGMQDLGYIEGKNVLYDFRWAFGKVERLPELANELIALKPDVLIGPGVAQTRTLQQATTTIPIVMANVSDPVGERFAKSLARPGGTITGLSTLSGDYSPKLLELLQAVVPKLSHVAILLGFDTGRAQLTNLQTATKTMGVATLVVEARTPVELENAFARMAREPVGAAIVLPSSVFTLQKRQIAELAIKNRMPAAFVTREYPEVGGLMSYGSDYADQIRSTATYVDRILKGAKPGNLPIEQPRTLNLVINLKTAKALGLTIPQSVLIRADEVIQ